MGFLDKLFGKKSGAEAAPPQSFSDHVRGAGLDPSGLKFSINSDGALTVSGQLADAGQREKIVATLNDIPAVNSVNDQMSVAVAAADDVEKAADSVFATGDAGAAGGEGTASGGGEAAAGRTYTVESGDTLWKISQAMYGDGSKYMKIFEANTSILDNPDRIFPGQVLNIPELGD